MHRHVARSAGRVGERCVDIPIFLDALLAVRDVLVDFNELCLKNHPVRFQS